MRAMAASSWDKVCACASRCRSPGFNPVNAAGFELHRARDAGRHPMPSIDNALGGKRGWGLDAANAARHAADECPMRR